MNQALWLCVGHKAVRWLVYELEKAKHHLSPEQYEFVEAHVGDLERRLCNGAAPGGGGSCVDC